MTFADIGVSQFNEHVFATFVLTIYFDNKHDLLVQVMTWIRVQFTQAMGKVIALAIPVVSAIIPKLYVNPCDCLLHILQVFEQYAAKTSGKSRREAEQYSFC